MATAKINWLKIMLLVTALSLPTLPVRADFSQTRTTQIQLRVDAPSGTAEANRLNGFAISGSGIDASGVLNQGSNLNPNTQFTAPTNSSPFNFSLNTFSADNTTPVSLTSTGNNSLPAYSKVSVTNGGNSEGLSGNISRSGEGTVTPGGSGTNAILTQTNSFSVFENSTF
ncbi:MULTISPECIES: hypothetical protein [Aerosakkonema]|uniref:hypothetical protein n=1 Tax=Aerosakkonema TaxID=1246629 RepID=UPI0035B7B5CB